MLNLYIHLLCNIRIILRESNDANGIKHRSSSASYTVKRRILHRFTNRIMM